MRRVVCLLVGFLAGIAHGQPCSSDWDCPSPEFLCVVNSEPQTMNFRIDDYGEVWADGVQYAGPFISWTTPYSVSIPPGTQVIAMEACNTILQAGILASFSTGKVSDSQWKCVEEDPRGRWQLPGYNDSAWHAAVEQGLNGMWPWGPIDDVASNAYWIWTTDRPNWHDCIYCRVRLARGQCIHGAECHNDCDCPEGLFCYRGHCVECVTHNDCDWRHYCRNYECVPCYDDEVCAVDRDVDVKPVDGVVEEMVKN